MRRLSLPVPITLGAAALLERSPCERRIRGAGARAHDPIAAIGGGARSRGHLVRRLLAVSAVAMLAGASPAAAATRADAVTPRSGSERNFVALLRPVSGEPAHAFGVVLFRQP